MIPSLETIGSIYVNTLEQKAKAKRAVLAHDPEALDIVQILGLDDE